MFKSGQGYIFEGRLDCNNRKGLKETFSIVNGKANLLVGVLPNGRISRAVYYTGDKGFQFLSDTCKSVEDVEVFLKSKRGTYALVGHSGFLAKVKYNLKTKDAEIEIFVLLKDAIIDGKVPGSVAYLLSTQDGYHLYKVSKKAYNSIVEAVKRELDGLDLTSKASYLTSRLNKQEKGKSCLEGETR